jgi:hypothetical protein
MATEVLGDGENGRSDLRNAILCTLAVVAAIFATWPFAELPFNDDWSYSWTVKQLDLTGRLTYNGWASASGIAQAYWGLIWVKAFGFSITVLRWSTIPLAAGAAAFCYLLARRAGLAAGSAVFVALVLGWSPLFLPVAATFMTDVPGLFCILFSLYAIVRGIESTRRGPAVGWLVAAAVVGLVGGTGRQIVWLAPGVGLPYAAWMLRRDRTVVAVAIVSWAGTVAAAVWTLRWFARQPYAIPEPSVARDVLNGLRHPAHMAMSVIALGLTLVLVILPGTIGLLQRRRSNRLRFSIAGVLLVGCLIVLMLRRRYAMMPWLDNTLDPVGVMGGSQLSGARPVALPVPVRLFLSVSVFAATALLVATGIVWLREQIASRRKSLFSITSVPPTVVLMSLFAVVYTAFLIPRATRGMAFDRYVLELMPCLLIPLLLTYRPSRWVGRVQWTMLAVWAAYGIAATQDVTALARARQAAADEVLAAGYKRTDVDAGFEYDYLTELVTNGYLPDRRIKNPPMTYTGADPTPSMQPLFRVEFNRVIETKPSRFPPVDYFSLLPPFHRRIYVDQFVNPYWREPGYYLTHPHERRHAIVLPGTAGL